MKKVLIEVDGMSCNMCEAHVNDIIRKEFNVKKVKSSHAKGETVILANEELDENALRSAIESMGYGVISIRQEDYQKRGFFGW